MIESTVYQSFAGWSIDNLITRTMPRPFLTKEIIHCTLGVSVFLGYKGLKWIWYFVTIQKTPEFPQYKLYTLHKLAYRIGLAQSRVCILAFGNSLSLDHDPDPE
jgi:hypothetical protein